jgi:uncharacterized protein YdeI (YjbR/CyaY-like superfamily)
MSKRTVPRELADLLASDPEAGAAFEKLPPSHQQEYVLWITEAKKEETRLKRSQKTIEMLLNKDHSKK